MVHGNCQTVKEKNQETGNISHRTLGKIIDSNMPDGWGDVSFVESSDYEQQDVNTRNSGYHLSIILLVKALGEVAPGPIEGEVCNLLKWHAVNCKRCSAGQAEQRLSSSVYEIRDGIRAMAAGGRYLYAACCSHAAPHSQVLC